MTRTVQIGQEKRCDDCGKLLTTGDHYEDVLGKDAVYCLHCAVRQGVAPEEILRLEQE